MDNEKWNEEKAWWTFLLHNENTITSRTNFFLVAQSFLAVAAVTIINNNLFYRLNFTAIELISWGGLIISIFWFLLGIKFYIRQGSVLVKVNKFFDNYKKLLEENDFPIISNKIIAIYIPIMFIIGWILFLHQIYCF